MAGRHAAAMAEMETSRAALEEARAVSRKQDLLPMFRCPGLPGFP